MESLKLNISQISLAANKTSWKKQQTGNKSEEITQNVEQREKKGENIKEVKRMNEYQNMLSERSQTESSTYCMHNYMKFKNRQN